MANGSTDVRFQSLIRLMYSLSYPAYTELAFVTNGVRMLSVQEQRAIKVIFQGVVCTTARLTRQRHPSNPPPTLICDRALKFSGITYTCGTAEGVDGSGVTTLYP